MSTLRVNNLKSRTGTAVTITSGHSLDVEGGLSIEGNSLVTGVSTFSGITSFTNGANVTGVVTFTELSIQSGVTTFSGNVNVGGVLTYEDVTNVDSVGMVTARGGIEIGAAGVGGTITSAGAAEFVGIVTASKFYGEGANITAISATNLGTGTVPTARLGSGTANNGTYLRGDSSWAALETNNAVRKVHPVYFSNTSASFNNQNGTQIGSTGVYYPGSGRIGGSFTKISGTSRLLVQGTLTYAMNSSNIHGFCVWIGGDEANFVNQGGDARMFDFYTTRSGNICVWPFSYCFNTAYSAGTVSAYAAPTVAGNRQHTGELNPDPNNNIVNNQGDTPGKDCHSCLTVIEFEP